MTGHAMATSRRNREDVGMRDVAPAKVFPARASVIASTLANVLRAGNTKTILTGSPCHKAAVILFAGHALMTSQICGVGAIASGSVDVRIATIRI